jgi:glycosyltransferase involved in cell wall biosynthesis
MSQSDRYPKVSIILPTHNRSGFILETIASVRSQTYRNWELLVIDDDSQDNTVSLIENIDDERVQLHKTPKRLGIAGSRNEGLNRASGELVAFIDSDDLWAETKLEKQVSIMGQYPEAGFSTTNGYDFKDINEPMSYFYKQKGGLRYGNVFISFFRSEAAATIPSLMIRRECLEIVGNFKEPNPTIFFLNLARQYDAVILYEPLFYRRVHDSNYSSINGLQRHEEGIRIIRNYKNQLPLDVFRDSLFRSYINFGERCILEKQRGRAIISFLRAWQTKPFNIIPFKKAGKAILQYLK